MSLLSSVNESRELHCPSCQWVPPPGAMDMFGRREEDGTYSLVCPTCRTTVISGIVYEGVPGFGTVSREGQ